ncbi:MAG: molybdopterin-dependent oxidoreductase [Clostridia bacterium]|nr:molybdopterin-dependent oxidoreductase [Clostridia bacterium]
MRNYLEMSRAACHIADIFSSNKNFDKIEYDDLFRGTDADIYIPLWASVILNPDGLLFDETTLEVIKIYKANGYSCIDMEGNPEDYIGQLFRFVSYMASSLVNHEDDDRIKTLDAFLKAYLEPVADFVKGKIKEYGKSDSILQIADFLERFIASDYSFGTYDMFPEVLENGAADPIPVEKARIVKCANRNNCGNRCSAECLVQEGCILSIDTNSYFRETGMRLCVKGLAYRHTYLRGTRLRYPMKRRGERGEGKFERISWETAVQTVYENWKRLRGTYGPGSTYIQYGSGDMGGIACGKNWVKRLLNQDGGYLDYYGTYSSHCASYISPYIYGDNFSGHSTEDIFNSKLLVLWSHNPAETNFGTQSARVISEAKKKGLKVIAVDPRLSDSAKAFADTWIAPLPSTDGALADAICCEIFSRNLEAKEYIKKYCVGFTEDTMPEGVPKELNYRAYLMGENDGIKKDAKWAEKICGVKAEQIVYLATEMATAKPMKLWSGLGYQRTGNGEQAVRSVAAIACLTGNVGILGGGAAAAGFVAEEKRPTLPLGKNEYGAKISCFLWTDAILHGHLMTREHDHIQGREQLASDVKMMFNMAGNTSMNQHSDVNSVIPVLKDDTKCEFILLTDVFMTPTARYADMILPSPSFFEIEDMVRPWRSGHFLIYNNPCRAPFFGIRREYDWVEELSKKLGYYEGWSDGHSSYEDWLSDIYYDIRKANPELPSLEEFKATGGHQYQEQKLCIAYRKQIEDPEHNPFKTPSGKIEIFSKTIYEMGDWAGIPPIPGYTPCCEGPEDTELKKKYPLQLISYHSKRTTHSVQDGVKILEKADPHRLWINPLDAEQRGMADGMKVRLFNDRGVAVMTSFVTERVRPGVIAMTQGAWFTPDKDGIDRRGCINVFTSTVPTPFSKGNPQQTNLAEVEIYTG